MNLAFWLAIAAVCLAAWHIAPLLDRSKRWR